VENYVTSSLDARQLLQQIARPERLDALLEQLKWIRNPGKYGLCQVAHRLRILVGGQGQKGGYGAQSRREQDEEGQLLLGINGHLVERRQQFAIRALGARGIWIEEMAALQRIRQHAKRALPGAVQQIEGPLHLLPVL